MLRIVKKILFVIAFIAIALIDHSDSLTPIRKCNNGKPLPLMVQIDNCQTLPCDFWKGSQSNMTVQFVATKNSMCQLRADVRLKTLGAVIPFELEEARSNVCKNLMYGAYCPLDSGEDVTFHLLMSISNYKPEVPINIEVNVIDRSDETIVACFVTDGRIKKQYTSLNKSN